MRIIIDSRERDLYTSLDSIITDKTNEIRIENQVLDIGDVYLKSEEKDILLMERKTIPDLLASIKDGRYEEQSHRLIYSSGFQNHNIIYIIEGSLSNIQLSDKKMVFSCITSLNYYKGFSVFRTNTVKETAELIYYMSEKINRNMKKGIQPFSQEKNMDNEQNEQIDFDMAGHMKVTI